MSKGAAEQRKAPKVRLCEWRELNDLEIRKNDATMMQF